MKSIFFLLIPLFIYSKSKGQTATWDDVYSIIQTNCASCHTAGHISGLDLSGSASETHAVLYNVDPSNASAAAKNFKRIKAGDPYSSFLFTKINNGLALDVSLGAGEGDPCPQLASPLPTKDIELIRQWILFGAGDTGELVDKLLIADFYDNDGITAVTSPPVPPPAGMGYQIHLGPYFLWPEEEHEYWYKFEPYQNEAMEVNRLDTYMGDYSHHFIMYKYYNLAVAATVDYGLHDGPDFNGVELVYGHQFADSLKLPSGTAFSWDESTLLNLNSHYINYSSDKSLSAEVYINVFTQNSGTALQIMHTIRKSNSDIYIPNDNMPYTFADTSFGNGYGEAEMFVWAMTSHTHKLGTDFDIYKRTEDGEKGEHIFDAACGATEGTPDCLDQIYDYQHPPTRKWPLMLPVKWKNGFISEVTFINDGPVPVHFGMSAEDEMAVFMYFYVEDTTGLNLSEETIGVTNLQHDILKIYPNPADEILYISSSENDSEINFYLTDITGRTFIDDQKTYQTLNGEIRTMDIRALHAGIYLLTISSSSGTKRTEKIIIQ